LGTQWRSQSSPALPLSRHVESPLANAKGKILTEGISARDLAANFGRHLGPPIFRRQLGAAEVTKDAQPLIGKRLRVRKKIRRA
jgi:hypothetical protein